jgi:hypothetical protein
VGHATAAAASVEHAEAGAGAGAGTVARLGTAAIPAGGSPRPDPSMVVVLVASTEPSVAAPAADGAAEPARRRRARRAGCHANSREDVMQRRSSCECVA